MHISLLIALTYFLLKNNIEKPKEKIHKKEDKKPINKENKMISLIEKEKKNTNKNDIPGSFEFDVPEIISGAKLNTNNEILLEIEWKPRYDKIKPKNSLFQISELKKNCPFLLIDFLETKLKFKSSI